MRTKQLLDYTLPVLKKNNTYGEFIEYQVFNFEKLQYVHYRIRLHKIRQQHPTRRDYLNCVHRIMNRLAQRLAEGWTPNGDEISTKMFFPLHKALDIYIEDRRTELRDSSMVSYASVCHILQEWLHQKHLDGLECRLFSKCMAVEYMEDLLKHDRFNNNTYNTYLKKYRVTWNWFVDHGYCVTNPFSKIRTRMKEPKKRIPIPSDTRQRVLSYVRTKGNPNFEIVMHLVFSSLIRPAEITRIQIGDISIKDACIHLSSEKAKTHKERYAPLSDACIQLLIRLLANGYPNDWYLLGKDLVPSQEQCWGGRFKKEWMKIRKECHLPDSMQLYSLKDSGITELLESGLDVLTVMKAADHHDLATTTKYTSQCDNPMISKVRAAKVKI